MAKFVSQKSQDILAAALAQIEAEEKAHFTVRLHRIGEANNNDLEIGKHRRGRYHITLLERRNLLVHEKPDFKVVSGKEYRAICHTGKPVEEEYRVLEGTYESEEALMAAVSKFPKVTYNDGRLYLGQDDGGPMSVIIKIAIVTFLGE